MGSESADGPPTEVSTVPWKDKDPPPGFDGDVDKFKDYLRELKMWRHETDVPVRKHGVKSSRLFRGPPRQCAMRLRWTSFWRRAALTR